LEEQLLQLDRQAILGRLSGGLVHAINNLLGGVLGQVDILLLVRKEPQIQTDLEQIASVCDEGVVLTRSLNRLINTLNDPGPTNPQPVFEALQVLLGRIYRRAGIERITKISGISSQVPNGAEFTQAAAHLMSMAFAAFALTKSATPSLTLSLQGEGNVLRLILESTSTPLAKYDGIIRHPGDTMLEGGSWSWWVLNTVTRRTGANWSVDRDGHQLLLDWPFSPVAINTIF